MSTRTVQKNVRLTEEELQLIIEAAGNRPLSQWIRTALLAAAKACPLCQKQKGP